MKLKHYYHIYCDSPLTLEIIDEHLQALSNNELGMRMHIGLVGSPENRTAVLTHLDSRSADYEVVAVADDGWEQVTLDALHDWAQTEEEETFVLYSHTKGAVNDYPLARAWRKEMTFWCVSQARRAISHLTDGATAVGIHWLQGLPNQPKMFGGNIWWSRTSVLRQIPRPSMENRYMAELYIGFAEQCVPDCRIINLCPADIGAALPSGEGNFKRTF